MLRTQRTFENGNREEAVLILNDVKRGEELVYEGKNVSFINDIRVEGRLTLKNCTVENPSKILLRGDARFENCRFTDVGEGFLTVEPGSIFEAENTTFSLTDHVLPRYAILATGEVICTFKNCTFEVTVSALATPDRFNVPTYIYAPNAAFADCTFLNLRGEVAIKVAKNCSFKNCRSVRIEYASAVEGCAFKNCYELYFSDSEIKECTFESCGTISKS